jgi:ribosomal protein S18 acetylase RimI-like enzyme
MPELSLQRTDFFSLSDKILSARKSFQFKSRGSSMAPFIRGGDILTVQPAEASILKVGDIIFCRTEDNRLLVHRIVERFSKNDVVLFRVRGDSAMSVADTLPAKRILGKIIRIHRGKKSIDINNKVRGFFKTVFIHMYPMPQVFFRAHDIVRSCAGRMLRTMQSIKLYRITSRKLFSKTISYDIVTPQDAFELSRFYGYERLHTIKNPTQSVAEQIKNLQGNGYTLIARRSGKIIGALIITTVPDDKLFYPDWWIFGMRISGRYRGMGIGENLLMKAMQIVSDEKGLCIHLIVSEKNKAAVQFYRQTGFKRNSIPALAVRLEEEFRQGQRRRIIMSRDI